MNQIPNVPENWPVEAAKSKKTFRRTLENFQDRKGIAQLPSLHEEAFSKINCLDCANCCKHYSPRFNQRDIKRIAKTLGIKEGELVNRYLYLDKDNDYVLKNQPCPFLAEDNTCRIYDDRPLDCRRYPYTDEDVLVKQIALTLKNATVCPAVFYILKKMEQSVL